jgi:hypothetical protein
MYTFFKYSYDVEFDDIEEYKFLFRNPSELKTLIPGIGQIRDTDQIYSYNTKDGLFIEIHEFYAINEYSMDRVEFDFINKFPDYIDWDGRQLNSDLINAPIISLKDHLPFNNALFVDFNKNAPIDLMIDKANCKVYYGSLLKMMLSGANREPLVMYDFSNVSNLIIAFYKTKYRFLIITISPNKRNVKKEDIDVLKLECSNHNDAASL